MCLMKTVGVQVSMCVGFSWSHESSVECEEVIVQVSVYLKQRQSYFSKVDITS